MFHEQQIRFAGSGKPNVGVLRSSHKADARDQKQSQRKQLGQTVSHSTLFSREEENKRLVKKQRTSLKSREL